MIIKVLKKHQVLSIHSLLLIVKYFGLTVPKKLTFAGTYFGPIFRNITKLVFENLNAFYK